MAEKLDIFMTWACGPRPFRGGTVEKPVWANVTEKIDRAFEAGGSVGLESVQRVLEPRQGWRAVESITMTSEPGMFRLSVGPRVNADEFPSLRHWWQPGSAEPRGTARIWDDEWDSSMVCRDVEAAKALFREFFESRKVTQYIIDNTKE